MVKRSFILYSQADVVTLMDVLRIELEDSISRSLINFDSTNCWFCL